MVEADLPIDLRRYISAIGPRFDLYKADNRMLGSIVPTDDDEGQKK